MKQPDPSPKNEQADKAPTENTCAESPTASKLAPKSLRLLIVMLGRLLRQAVRVCDEIADLLKTK